MSTDPLPPEQPAPAPAPDQSSLTAPSKDDKTMAMLCHIGLGVLSSFLVPLIIWLIKKDQSKFVNDQGKESLNFGITLFIGHVIGGATICFTFGLLNLAVYLAGIVFGIIAGMAANRGELYRYPIN